MTSSLAGFEGFRLFFLKDIFRLGLISVVEQESVSCFVFLSLYRVHLICERPGEGWNIPYNLKGLPLPMEHGNLKNVI